MKILREVILRRRARKEKECEGQKRQEKGKGRETGAGWKQGWEKLRATSFSDLEFRAGSRAGKRHFLALLPDSLEAPHVQKRSEGEHEAILQLILQSSCNFT